MSCSEGGVVRIRGSRARVKEKMPKVVCKEELTSVVCCYERVGKGINVTIQVPIEEAPRFTAFTFPGSSTCLESRLPIWFLSLHLLHD